MKESPVHVITFEGNGTARCLWTEAVPLHELGRLEIHRASTIEFNNGAQHWEVRGPNGSPYFFSRSREECLDWERRNVDVLR